MSYTGLQDEVTGIPPEFQAFKKIPRLNRECIITEKIDGTNAQTAIAISKLPSKMMTSQNLTPEQYFILVLIFFFAWYYFSGGNGPHNPRNP